MIILRLPGLDKNTPYLQFNPPLNPTQFLTNKEKIEMVKYKLNLLQAKYQLLSWVKARTSGEIISISPGNGDYIHTGMLIYRLQPKNSRLEAILYLPSTTQLDKINHSSFFAPYILNLYSLN